MSAFARPSMSPAHKMQLTATASASLSSLPTPCRYAIVQQGHRQGCTPPRTPPHTPVLARRNPLSPRGGLSASTPSLPAPAPAPLGASVRGSYAAPPPRCYTPPATPGHTAGRTCTPPTTPSGTSRGQCFVASPPPTPGRALPAGAGPAVCAVSPQSRTLTRRPSAVSIIATPPATPATSYRAAVTPPVTPTRASHVATPPVADVVERRHVARRRSSPSPVPCEATPRRCAQQPECAASDRGLARGARPSPRQPEARSLTPPAVSSTAGPDSRLRRAPHGRPEPSDGGLSRGAPPSPRAEARSCTPPAVASSGPQGAEAALATRISELLRVSRESVLKVEVARCFKEVARGETCVDLEGLRCFRSLLAKALDVPEETMANLSRKYVCFDFDGDGRLNFNEAYKMVKHHLWVHLKRCGFVPRIYIPNKSLEDAGLKTVKELGRGNQGVVLLVEDGSSRTRCAKRIGKTKMLMGGVSELREEFETLRRLSCRHIAQVYEIFQDEEFYYTIGEAYHGGDLTTLRVSASQQCVSMTENWWRGIFRQCVEALEYLHGQALMHCDIKEPNIMLKTRDFSAPQVVLIDFGVVKAMAAADEGFVGGTPGYIPPETWQHCLWFPNGDIFSMGVCFAQLLLGMVPSDDTNGIFQDDCQTLLEVRSATMHRDPPLELMPKEMPGLKAMVERMLQKEMELRPRAPQLLLDPWFLEGPPPAVPMAKYSKSVSPGLLGTQGISKAFYDAVPARRQQTTGHLLLHAGDLGEGL